MHDTITKAFDSPWLIRNELERFLLIPWAALSFRLAGVDIARGWQCYGLPILQKHRQSQMVIGKNASFRSQRRSNPLGVYQPCILSTRTAQATLVIGDGFGMTGGAIVCAESIQIGARVWLGANTVITDTDFHPLDPHERLKNPSAGQTAPVNIADDVFIGMQVLILKGVSIGAGAVIGAGSVVSRDIPAGAVAAGNPARVLRESV